MLKNKSILPVETCFLCLRVLKNAQGLPRDIRIQKLRIHTQITIFVWFAGSNYAYKYTYHKKKCPTNRNKQKKNALLSPNLSTPCCEITYSTLNTRGGCSFGVYQQGDIFSSYYTLFLCLSNPPLLKMNHFWHLYYLPGFLY